MFKAIKEFFVGKPKTDTIAVEAPYKVETEVVVTEPATVSPVAEAGMAQPVETVTISATDNVSVNLEPDTITVSATGAWPFPNTPPAEPAVKKKRTFVKRQEPAADKKPTPAIKVNKNKPRKKK
jgi:hypothetical protein